MGSAPVSLSLYIEAPIATHGRKSWRASLYVYSVLKLPFQQCVDSPPASFYMVRVPALLVSLYFHMLKLPWQGFPYLFFFADMRSVFVKGKMYLWRELVFMKRTCTCIYEGNLYLWRELVFVKGNLYLWRELVLVFTKGTCICEGNLYLWRELVFVKGTCIYEGGNPKSPIQNPKSGIQNPTFSNPKSKIQTFWLDFGFWIWILDHYVAVLFVRILDLDCGTSFGSYIR